MTWITRVFVDVWKKFLQYAYQRKHISVLLTVDCMESKDNMEVVAKDLRSLHLNVSKN